MIVAGAVALMICSAANSFAACPALSYFVASDATDQTGDGPHLMQVSMARRDVTLENLVCLTQLLRREHDSGLMVYVLDARYAADEFKPLSYELSGHDLDIYKQLRARYVFDPAAHQEYLRITPLGYEREESYDTTIDLPADEPPRCRVSLVDRCLFMFDTIDLEEDAAVSDFRGSIGLTARLGRDGSVSHVRVIASRGAPTAALRRVIGAVTTNLRRWWFEPTASDVSLKITYDFGGSVPAPDSGGRTLTLDLPNRATVRVTAMKNRPPA